MHVVILGVALFALHRWMAPPRASQEIVVPGDAMAGLREDFRRRTGRTPTPADEQALLDAYVNDEVLVREGLALGLDRGDIIVRRRLLQKMEFLLENAEPVPAPSDADLESYLRSHTDRYASPGRVSFTHVFVASERAGGQAASEAAVLRTQLDGGADPSTLGDPFLRGSEVHLRTQAELATMFGAPFAAAVLSLPRGPWSEPIQSSFGWHVVRVSETHPGVEPVLADVRARVEHDWRAERREALDRDARARLRSHYVVRVEGPSP